MNKKRVGVFICFLFIIIVLMSVVSAGWFTDLFKKAEITGKVITYNSEGWTTWLDRDGPSGSGDYETLSDFRSTYPELCETPLDIECRKVGTTNSFSFAADAPQVVTVSPTQGCSCVNTNSLCKGTNTYDCGSQDYYPCNAGYIPFCEWSGGNCVEKSCSQLSSQYCNSYGCSWLEANTCYDYEVRFKCPTTTSKTCESCIAFGSEYYWCVPTQSCASIIGVDPSSACSGEFFVYGDACSVEEPPMPSNCESCIAFGSEYYWCGQTETCEMSAGTPNCDMNTYVSYSYGECLTEGPPITTPTCNDGLKNGDEEGVDCGGSCNLCVTEEEWTNWLDRDNPGGKGDYETLDGFTNVCAEPLEIECRKITSDKSGTVFSTPEEALSVVGQVLGVSPKTGCSCVNAQNTNYCKDYEVRFKCPVVEVPACIDHDEGFNPSIPSTVEMPGIHIFTDECSSIEGEENILIERLCEEVSDSSIIELGPHSTQMGYIGFYAKVNCPNGCVENANGYGACVEEITPECTDLYYQIYTSILNIAGNTRDSACCSNNNSCVYEGACFADNQVTDFTDEANVAFYEEVKSFRCKSGIWIVDENKKDTHKYSNKEVFLISDKDWRAVLPLVPLTTWTGSENCKKGYGTPSDVCVYPTLIFHEEIEKPTTLTLKSTIIASSSTEEEYSSKLLDWDTSTAWNSGSIEEASLKLDFKQIKEFDKIEVYEVSEPYYLNIYASKDDITYYPLIENHILELGWNSFSFGPVNARYVQFILKDNPDQGKYPNWKTLSEIRVSNNDEKIPHKSFDVDSIICFIQQYNAEKIILVGETPQELDNLLIAEPELGAGLNQEDTQRISVEDYLSYWKNIETIVYVENDYELALLASTYASLINAPLLIEGYNDNIDLNDKKIVCVGEVGQYVNRLGNNVATGYAAAPPKKQIVCTEKYTLRQLQQKYVEETNTDKIMLINPNDLDIAFEEKFQPEKSGNPIYELYSKTSLAAPILASAKHELIISTKETDYKNIDGFIEEEINRLVPEIVNNPLGIESFSTTSKFVKKDLLNGQEEEILSWKPLGFPRNVYISEKILVWEDKGNFYSYNLETDFIEKLNYVDPEGTYSTSLSLYGENLIFQRINWSLDKAEIVIHNLNDGKEIVISTDMSGNPPFLFENNLVWQQRGDSGNCYFSEEFCDNSTPCTYKSCSPGLWSDACDIDADCDEEKICEPVYCNKKSEIYLYDLETRKIKKIDQGGNYWELKGSGDKLTWIDNNVIFIYDLLKNEKKSINRGTWLKGLDIYGDNLLITDSFDSDYSQLKLYNIKTEEEEFIGDVPSMSEQNSKIYKDKVFFFKEDNESQKYCFGRENDLCDAWGDCGYCSQTQNRCSENGDCDSEEYCYYQSCTSKNKYLYEYDLQTKLEQEIRYFDIPPQGSSDSYTIPEQILFKFYLGGNNLFYLEKENNYFHIYGYLTIFAAPNAIPAKIEVSRSPCTFSRSLDYTQYGDVYLEDMHSDLAIGRIQGITISDVSSLLSRTLFYNEIDKTNNVQFMASHFEQMMFSAEDHSRIFKNSGYNSDCSIFPILNSDKILEKDFNCEVVEDKERHVIWSNLWENSQLIMYLDHGGPGYSGISSDEIPYLDNSLVFSNSCSTCSTYNRVSFCNNALRKGAISYAGALDTAWTNKVYTNMINDIYYRGYSIGESYANSFDTSHDYVTLLGDPTLNINPNLLKEELKWMTQTSTEAERST